MAEWVIWLAFVTILPIYFAAYGALMVKAKRHAHALAGFSISAISAATAAVYYSILV